MRCAAPPACIVGSAVAGRNAKVRIGVAEYSPRGTAFGNAEARRLRNRGSEATACGPRFVGRDRVLFASDSPFDPEKGAMYTRTTIGIVDRLDLSPEERHMIYEGNARRLLELPAAAAPAAAPARGRR